MPTRYNAGIVTKRDVTRTAVAVEQFNKLVSAETNTSNNRRALFSVVRAEGLQMTKKSFKSVEI
jgi:hypothetical protein